MLSSGPWLNCWCRDASFLLSVFVLLNDGCLVIGRRFGRCAADVRFGKITLLLLLWFNTLMPSIVDIFVVWLFNWFLFGTVDVASECRLPGVTNLLFCWFVNGVSTYSFGRRSFSGRGIWSVTLLLTGDGLLPTTVLIALLMKFDAGATTDIGVSDRVTDGTGDDAGILCGGISVRLLENVLIAFDDVELLLLTLLLCNGVNGAVAGGIGGIDRWLLVVVIELKDELMELLMLLILFKLLFILLIGWWLGIGGGCVLIIWMDGESTVSGSGARGRWTLGLIGIDLGGRGGAKGSPPFLRSMKHMRSLIVPNYSLSIMRFYFSSFHFYWQPCVVGFFFLFSFISLDFLMFSASIHFLRRFFFFSRFD